MIVKSQSILLVFASIVGCAVSGQVGSSKESGRLPTSGDNSVHRVSEGSLLLI
jgi:hypothetical protein